MNRSERRRAAREQRTSAIAPVSSAAEATFRELAAAMQLHQAGDLKQAAGMYEHILAREPGNAEAMHLLGVIANSSNQSERALELIGRAIAIDPRKADYHLNFGCAMERLGRLDEAVAACRRATKLDPRDANIHYNLALFLQKQDRLEDAETHYRATLKLTPGDAEAIGNLGVVLMAMGRTDKAIAQYRGALARAPEQASTHQNLGHALLLRGDFAQGWAEYEWRWRNPEFPSERRNFARPRWDGTALAGRTILLYAEQGLGDAIQFVRFAPLVAARGGRVIVECKAPLAELLATCEGVAAVTVLDAPLPEFDVHAPLLSLPHLLGITLENLPADVPYLRPPDGRGPAPIAAPDNALKVGLVWAGSPDHGNDRKRSCPLDRLAPLFEVPGVNFYSLQTGPRAADLAGAGAIVDLGGGLASFADTAAAIAGLDLVISVDTAVAHLAGAMARPVWILLPKAPDWRWLTDRTDSPWYPTARLFRQPARGDWDGVASELAESLARLAECGAKSP